MIASDEEQDVQYEPLRLGILGAARIALGGVMPAASRTPLVEVSAVATRGGKKAPEASRVAPEAHIYEDYASLLRSSEVDAVYIPLPNSMHVEWTLEALGSGKHVLCEKPLSLNVADARKAIETARDAGLALMEGFMYRLHPQTIRLRELLGEGAVGEIRQVVTQFGHRLDDPEDIRGLGTLDGGSLGDVGCYCVSSLRLAFDSEPHTATALARFAEDGADREFTGVLAFEQGLGLVSCGISSARRERMEVSGTEGLIVLDAPFRPDKSGGTIELTRGSETHTESFEKGDPYRLELEEFAAAIREKRDPLVGPDEILGNARALEALLESARAGGRAREV